MGFNKNDFLKNLAGDDIQSGEDYLNYYISYISSRLYSLSIDTQVILQILVEKGICTRDEIAIKRKVCEANSPTLKELKIAVQGFQNRAVDKNHSAALLNKLFTNKDSMTPEEKKELDNILKNMSKNK